jgi:hypothetical protein
MNPWLKIFLRASGFGAGAVVAAVLAIGAWFYITSILDKAKPWDRETISAMFADLYVTPGDQIVTTFRYTVENKTKKDYNFPEDPKSAFVILPEGKGLSQEENISWSHGAYLPSGQKMALSFQLTYEYNESYPKKDRDNSDKLARFMDRRLKEVDGFVILDKAKRYEIIFPKGWNATDEKKK